MRNSLTEFAQQTPHRRVYEAIIHLKRNSGMGVKMLYTINLYSQYNDKSVHMCYSGNRIAKSGPVKAGPGKEKAMLSRSFVPAYLKQERLEALKIYQSFNLLCLYKMEREWKQMPVPARAG